MNTCALSLYRVNGFYISCFQFKPWPSYPYKCMGIARLCIISHVGVFLFHGMCNVFCRKTQGLTVLINDTRTVNVLVTMRANFIKIGIIGCGVQRDRRPHRTRHLANIHFRRRAYEVFITWKTGHKHVITMFLFNL